MMKCVDCGSDNKDDSKYCEQCGAKLPKTEKSTKKQISFVLKRRLFPFSALYDVYDERNQLVYMVKFKFRGYEILNKNKELVLKVKTKKLIQFKPEYEIFEVNRKIGSVKAVLRFMKLEYDIMDVDGRVIADVIERRKLFKRSTFIFRWDQKEQIGALIHNIWGRKYLLELDTSKLNQNLGLAASVVLASKIAKRYNNH